jgi:hypothetical protein
MDISATTRESDATAARVAAMISTTTATRLSGMAEKFSSSIMGSARQIMIHTSTEATTKSVIR